MSEIKSAWEIAREKAEKLGKLSAEEIRKQREEKGNSIGKALAEKYLIKPDLRELTEALNNYQGEEGKIIKQAVIAQLVQAVELKRGDRLKDISQGLLAFLPEEALTIVKDIEHLFEEYKQAEQTVKRQIDTEGREILHRFRISGTAIGGINPEAKEEWQKVLTEFAQPFIDRLNELKQKLLEQSKQLQSNSEK